MSAVAVVSIPRAGMDDSRVSEPEWTVDPVEPTHAGYSQLMPPVAEDTVVIVPSYKEAGAIGGVIDELREGLNPKVLVVDRPGNDDTGAVARARGAVVVDQPNRGKGSAVRIGLDFVRRHYPEARYIGLVDADMTYPTAPLPEMRAILESDPSVGMVVARRMNLKNNGIKSQFFAAGNRVLAEIHRTVNGIPLKDPLSGLRLIRSDAVDGWTPRARGFDIECELNHQVHNVRRLTISEIPVRYRARVGEKKLGLRHGVTILGRMLSLVVGRVRTSGRQEPP